MEVRQHSTNGEYLRLIEQVEANIVDVVRASGLVVEAVAVLASDDGDRVSTGSDDDDDEDSDAHAHRRRFERRYAEFVRLLNEIQFSLRKVIRHLSKTGILSSASNLHLASTDLSLALEKSSLPYRGSAEGLETDLGVSIGALEVVLASIRAGVEDVYGVDLESST